MEWPTHIVDQGHAKNLWTRLVGLRLMQQEAEPALQLLAHDRKVAENHLTQLGQTNGQVAAQRSKMTEAAEQRRAQGHAIDTTWLSIDKNALEMTNLCTTGKARKVVQMRAAVHKSTLVEYGICYCIHRAEAPVRHCAAILIQRRVRGIAARRRKETARLATLRLVKAVKVQAVALGFLGRRRARRVRISKQKHVVERGARALQREFRRRMAERPPPGFFNVYFREPPGHEHGLMKLPERPGARRRLPPRDAHGGIVADPTQTRADQTASMLQMSVRRMTKMHKVFDSVASRFGQRFRGECEHRNFDFCVRGDNSLEYDKMTTAQQLGLGPGTVIDVHYRGNGSRNREAAAAGWLSQGAGAGAGAGGEIGAKGTELTQEMLREGADMVDRMVALGFSADEAQNAVRRMLVGSQQSSRGGGSRGGGGNDSRAASRGGGSRGTHHAFGLGTARASSPLNPHRCRSRDGRRSASPAGSSERGAGGRTITSRGKTYNIEDVGGSWGRESGDAHGHRGESWERANSPGGSAHHDQEHRNRAHHRHRHRHRHRQRQRRQQSGRHRDDHPHSSGVNAHCGHARVSPTSPHGAPCRNKLAEQAEQAADSELALMIARQRVSLSRQRRRQRDQDLRQRHRQRERQRERRREAEMAKTARQGRRQRQEKHALKCRAQHALAEPPQPPSQTIQAAHSRPAEFDPQMLRQLHASVAPPLTPGLMGKAVRLSGLLSPSVPASAQSTHSQPRSRSRLGRRRQLSPISSPSQRAGARSPSPLGLSMMGGGGRPGSPAHSRGRPTSPSRTPSRLAPLGSRGEPGSALDLMMMPPTPTPLEHVDEVSDAVVAREESRRLMAHAQDALGIMKAD